MAQKYIISAENAGNLSIRLTFNDGHVSTVDVGEFIRRHPHPQYNKYLESEWFNSFRVEEGNVVWGEDWDLVFPIEDLYSGSVTHFHKAS